MFIFIFIYIYYLKMYHEHRVMDCMDLIELNGKYILYESSVTYCVSFMVYNIIILFSYTSFSHRYFL